MYIVIWAYQTQKRQRKQFEATYGPEGAWAKLFCQSKHYIGTELLQSDDVPGQYLTIDRWQSEKAYLLFLEDRKDDYRVLDNHCARLSVSQEFLGRYVN